MTRYVDADALIAYVNANIVTPPTTPPPVTPPPVTSGVVFSAPFSDTTNWTVGQTSSYPAAASGVQTNPSDNKLDAISPSWSAPNGARFYANKVSGQWQCDLVTTEGSSEGFQVQVGDTVSATVTLHSGGQIGAWPAIWTWYDGDNEVDLFEYHPDNPTLLELSNHLGSGSVDYPNNVITPGTAFVLKVVMAEAGVQWYVNGKLLTTGAPLPASWKAYLIVNMSVSAGEYHAAPAASTTQLYFDVANLQVVRPSS